VNRRVCEIHGFCSPILIGQAVACPGGSGDEARDHHSLVSSQSASGACRQAVLSASGCTPDESGALSLRVTEFAGEAPSENLGHD